MNFAEEAGQGQSYPLESLLEPEHDQVEETKSDDGDEIQTVFLSGHRRQSIDIPEQMLKETQRQSRMLEAAMERRVYMAI